MVSRYICFSPCVCVRTKLSMLLYLHQQLNRGASHCPDFQVL